MSDLIRRSDAVTEIHKYFVAEIEKTPTVIDEDGDELYADMTTVNSLLACNKELSKRIKALPSAEAVHKPDYSYEADMVRRLKEALSAETHDKRTETHGVCSDLISRAEALKEIEAEEKRIDRDIENAKENPNNYTDNFVFAEEERVNGLADAYIIIEGLPSAEAVQGWIPCSERLPKEKQEVYVTVYFTEGDTGRAYGYVDGFGRWHLYSTVEGTLNSGYDVTAWMPLPEPYKGGDDDV